MAKAARNKVLKTLNKIARAYDDVTVHHGDNGYPQRITVKSDPDNEQRSFDVSEGGVIQGRKMSDLFLIAHEGVTAVEIPAKLSDEFRSALTSPSDDLRANLRAIYALRAGIKSFEADGVFSDRADRLAPNLKNSSFAPELVRLFRQDWLMRVGVSNVLYAKHGFNAAHSINTLNGGVMYDGLSKTASMRYGADAVFYPYYLQGKFALRSDIAGPTTWYLDRRMDEDRINHYRAEVSNAKYPDIASITREFMLAHRGDIKSFSIGSTYVLKGLDWTSLTRSQGWDEMTRAIQANALLLCRAYGTDINEFRNAGDSYIPYPKNIQPSFGLHFE